MIYVGTITDIHINPDGLPIFTATDVANNTYYPCSFVSNLGGFDGRFTHPSLVEGTRVILAAYGPNVYNQAYFAIGFLPDPDDATAISVDGVPTALEAEAIAIRDQRETPDVLDAREAYVRNEDYEGTHIEDAHMEVQDSFINISTPHGITIAGDPRISLQIPENTEESCVRISAGGVAENAVLNAVPHLDRLFEYIGTLQRKIDALEKVVNAIAPSAIAALETSAAAADAAVPGSGTPIRQQSTDATEGIAEATNMGALTPASTIREQSDQDINPYVIIP